MGWVEAGRPTEEGTAWKILQKYGSEGSITTGPKGGPGVDVQTLERFITGQGSLYNPEDIRYNKLAQEGLVMQGDDKAVVLDSHMIRLFGGNPLTGKAYFAGKDLVTKAAKAEGLDPAAAQAAMWAVARTFGGKSKITAEQALQKIGQGEILKEGESYAELLAKDPELKRTVERIFAATGSDAEKGAASLSQIAQRPKSQEAIAGSKAEASKDIFRRY